MRLPTTTIIAPGSTWLPARRPQVIVLPWYSPKSPRLSCGVTVFPREEALAHAGLHAPNLDAATSYFFDRFRTHDEEKGTHLFPASPSVIFLGKEVNERKARLAIYALAFATIVENDGSGGLYANASLFTSHIQNLGGEPTFFTHVTRRIHGRGSDGRSVENSLEVKPSWCGSFHIPNEELLAALGRAIHKPSASRLRAALEALMVAASDSDQIPADLERSHYALALELLLTPLKSTAKSLKQAHAEREERALCVLQPLLPSRRGTALPWIIRAWNVARNDRNDYWHPEKRKRRRERFEMQRKVHPNLISFRTLAALVIATLVDLGALDAKSKLAQYIASIEDWISAIRRNDRRTPEEAALLTPFLMRRLHDWTIDRGLETITELRRKGRLPTAERRRQR